MAKKNKDYKKMAVSVLVPAYNEEASISNQIEAIREILLSNKITHEVIVIDDGSKDCTAEIALKARARVLHHHQNRGYGAALKTGISAAKYESVVIIDADGTYPTDQIPNLINKLENADMVVGARIGKEVKIPMMRRPAKWILGWLASRIAGEKIPDLNSGMRAFRRNVIKQYFPILSDRFSFTTTSTLALLNDSYRIDYHTIDYYRRIGKSKITPWNFMEFIMLILRIAILFQPLKIFLPIGLVCGLLGTLKTVFDIIAMFEKYQLINLELLFKPVISTSAILLILCGLQLILIGMVSDALLRRFPRYHRQTDPYQEVWLSESNCFSEQEQEELRLDTQEGDSIKYRQLTRPF